MNRKVLNTVLILLLATGTIWLGLRLFNRLSHPERSPLNAVPNTAAIVLRVPEPFTLWKNISRSNLIWEDLKSAQPFLNIHRAATQIDSIAGENAGFAKICFGRELVASIHPSGKEGSDILFAIQQKESEEQEIVSVLTSILKDKKPVERKIKNGIIHQFFAGNSEWHLLIKNDFITFSSSASLAESVAFHLEEQKNITQEEGWSTVYSTGDPNAQINVFLHHKNFSSLLNNWVSAEMQESLSQTNPYALFTEMDLSISSGTISMNGFTSAKGSGNYFLSLFADHEPQEFTAARILPENTAAFLWLGINDGESFHTSIEKWLDRDGKLQEHQQDINTFNSENDCDIRRELLSWAGNEIVLFSNGKKDTSGANSDLFLAIRINEIVDPITELNTLSAKLDTVQALYSYNGQFEIHRLAADNLFGLLFGRVFGGINQPWYLRIEDFIVFANSSSSLEHYLKDIGNDKSLAKNITYYNFVSENLSDRSNLTVYANPAQLGSVFTTLLDPEKAHRFEEQDALLKKFNAFAWQMNTAKNGLFYNNLYLKYNPAGKQDSKSLWETTLDTSAQFQPRFIKNHITGTKDILVQDDNYTIYLISGKGEISWKKNLEEKISGQIQQIDYFGNGKLQMLFATQSEIHLIDLKGNYMKGFPAKLNSEVSGEIGVFDYESNNNYRILIPVGKKILNMDKDGKITSGWEFSGSRSEIRQSPGFFRCENKDYLFVADESGELHILDRKGKPRYNLNFEINGKSANEITLEPGTTIENTSITFSDSSGRIIRRYFNGNADTASTGYRSSSHRFVLADANEDGKKEVILLDSNRIEIREWDGKLVGKYEFTENISPLLMYFPLKDGSLRIGAVSPAAGEIYLLLGDGTLHNKFPQKGTTAFSLGDINGDGTFEVISGTGTRRIVCYSIN